MVEPAREDGLEAERPLEQLERHRALVLGRRRRSGRRRISLGGGISVGLLGRAGRRRRLLALGGGGGGGGGGGFALGRRERLAPLLQLLPVERRAEGVELEDGRIELERSAPHVGILILQPSERGFGCGGVLISRECAGLAESAERLQRAAPHERRDVVQPLEDGVDEAGGGFCHLGRRRVQLSKLELELSIGGDDAAAECVRFGGEEPLEQLHVGEQHQRRARSKRREEE